MNSEQFCYWLQGRCELQPENVPSKEEWILISAHLQTVFQKITPNKLVQDSYLERMKAQNQTVVSPPLGNPIC